MVFDLANRRRRLRRAQSSGLALILLLAAVRAGADTVDDIVRNTVGFRIVSKGQPVGRGVGLFLGTYEGKALLLTPAHVVPDPEQIGKPDSTNSFQIRIAGALETYAYSRSAIKLTRTPIEDALRDDYLIVELPVGEAKRGSIANLTGLHLKRPDRNGPVVMFTETPQGGWASNRGTMEKISGGEVVTFEIKTQKILETGDSGSPIVGASSAVHGIYLEGGGTVGSGVYPAKELDSALQTIGRAKANPENLYGFSLAVVPTYQYSTKTQDLGGGTTHTDTQHGVYTSFELETFRLKRDPDADSATKFGLIAGYSGGKVHGLGQIDDAEYTIKWGIVAGGVNRVKNDTGQFGLFVLSHRENGKFVHRAGVSLDVMTELSGRNHYALDGGFRIEFNKLTTHNSSAGFGLVLRYTWLRAL
jgi:hypothetical protein